MRPLPFALRLVVLLWTRPALPALKALIGANVAMFLTVVDGLESVSPIGVDVRVGAGSRPRALWVWQPVTYMFLHGGRVPHPVQHAGALDVRDRARTDLGHALLPEILLRHRRRRRPPDGPRLAAAVGVLTAPLRRSSIIGASGAIYGLLLAYGMYFPDRPIYMFIVFPIPAKYFVMIMGAIAFFRRVQWAASPT